MHTATTTCIEAINSIARKNVSSKYFSRENIFPYFRKLTKANLAFCIQLKDWFIGSKWLTLFLFYDTYIKNRKNSIIRVLSITHLDRNIPSGRPFNNIIQNMFEPNYMSCCFLQEDSCCKLDTLTLQIYI